MTRRPRIAYRSAGGAYATTVLSDLSALGRGLCLLPVPLASAGDTCVERTVSVLTLTVLRVSVTLRAVHPDESKEHAITAPGLSKPDRSLQVYAIKSLSLHHCTDIAAGEVWAVPGRWRNTKTVVSRNAHVPLAR
jgi:hypothetical protein